MQGGIGVDTTYGRRTARGGHRTARGTRRPAQQAGTGDRRRLIQLLVSLVLFLLVYVGRGVFPAQFETWRAALDENVDFTAAFREFSQSISDGSTLGESLETLWVRVTGGEPEPRSEERRVGKECWWGGGAGP